MKKEIIFDIPQVGRGATYSIGTDCYPYTIVGVNKSGKTIKAQMDTAKQARGYHFFLNQVYNFSPNPYAEIETFTLRVNGRYVPKGWARWVGGVLEVGERNRYCDPHF